MNINDRIFRLFGYQPILVLAEKEYNPKVYLNNNKRFCVILCEPNLSFVRYLSLKKSFLFMIAGLVVFALYLYFYIGLSQITLVLNKVNTSQYAFYYSLALLAVLASVFFWSVAWNNILRALSIRVSYRRAYLYYWVSYFTDLVVPCATVW